MAYIELLGVTLSGVRRPDQGLYWTDLTGWWGLPDVRGSSDPIPGGHGSFKRSRLYRSSRAITLTGHILCKTNRELMETRARLENALAVGSGSMQVFTNTYGTWERGVEIDTLTIEPDHGKEYTKFTVDMVAPDPRRYGPELRLGPVDVPTSIGGVNLPQAMPWNFGSVSDGGRLQLHNSGLIPVAPTLIVSGGFQSVTVYNVTTGRAQTLEWPVQQGEMIRFDSNIRRVTSGETELTRWLTRREWFEVPPGATQEFRFEVTGQDGTPQMWAEYREGAW